jgi:leucyl/phenylalanyl-tRNA---protein transferase
MVRPAGTRRRLIGKVPTFPDPRGADRDGLVAVGGGLDVDRLVLAYEQGIFPWYDAGLPPLWWSPDPRAILDPQHLHISRSLRRRLRQGKYEVTLDRAFADVMRACAANREDGTWILPEMIDAYVQLFTKGYAHSLEVWMEGALAGGLYGVHVGGLFAAESMFHLRTNASKIALVAAVTTAFDAGIEVFDVQFVTPHLASMGAYAIPRDQYLARLAKARGKLVDLSHATPHWPA